mmetsp:Transcript_60368/g.141274  ORF Transcript_60368/g.141274 Transcript_60368/m.141274 type:complete len:297 (-) Transcript_60368:8-898(-)
MTVAVVGWITGILEMHNCIWNLLLNVPDQRPTSQDIEHLRATTKGKDWTAGVQGQTHQCKLQLILRDVELGVAGPLHGILSVQTVWSRASILVQDLIGYVVPLHDEQAIHRQVLSKSRNCQGSTGDHDGSTPVFLNQVQVVLTEEVYVLSLSEVSTGHTQHTWWCRPCRGQLPRQLVALQLGSLRDMLPPLARNFVGNPGRRWPFISCVAVISSTSHSVQGRTHFAMLTIFIGVNIPLVEPYDVKVGIHVIAWDLPALVNAGIRGDASIALSSTVCHRQQLQQSQELPRYQKSALP